MVLLYIIILSLAAEDVEEHIVTKTTKILEKSAPEAGSSLVIIIPYYIKIFKVA